MYGTETFLWFILAMFYISRLHRLRLDLPQGAHRVRHRGLLLPDSLADRRLHPGEAGVTLRRRAADHLPAANGGIHEMSRQDSI